LNIISHGISLFSLDKMNYPAAELRGIKMNFYFINPDAEHRGILLIKINAAFCPLNSILKCNGILVFDIL